MTDEQYNGFLIYVRGRLKDAESFVIDPYDLARICEFDPASLPDLEARWRNKEQPDFDYKLMAPAGDGPLQQARFWRRG